MTRYLDTLIAQARGAEPEIKPRLRLRFEPNPFDMPEAIDELSVESESVEPTGLRAADSKPERLPEADDGPHHHDPLRQDSDPGRDIIHHIQEHTERFERIEHHVTERETSHLVQGAVANQTMAPEQPVAQRILGEKPRKAETETSSEPLSQDPKSGHTPEPIHGVSAEIRPHLAEPAIRPESSSPFTVIAEMAASRRDPVEMFQAEAVPEIVISIGVLDIRMTQETAAEHRRPLRSADRRDHSLPLADYLAKRSGGGS